MIDLICKIHLVIGHFLGPFHFSTFVTKHNNEDRTDKHGQPNQPEGDEKRIAKSKNDKIKNC